MKKALLLFLAVCFLAAVAVPSAFAQKKPFDGVTLSILANSHDPMLKAVQWSIPVAKEKLGITLQMDQEAYGTEYNKATSAFASGAGQYDLIVAAHQWTGGWFEAGYLQSLDDFIKGDKEFDSSIYSPKAYLINSTVNGHQVGLPFNMEGRLMFYRKDIFAAEKLKVPTTEKEWLATVKYFADNQSKIRQKYGNDFYGACYMYGAEQGPAYPFSTYWGKFNWKKYKTDNGFWDDKYQNIMDEKLIAESFKFWANVLKYMPPGVDTYNLPEAYQFFLDGKCAMTEVWPLTLYGMLLDPKNDDIRKKTGVANIGYGLPFSGGWAISMVTTCKNKEAAWAYLKMMTTAQADFQFFRDYGKGPSVKATYTNPALSSKYGEWLKNQGEAIAAAVSPGKIATMSEFYGGDFWTIADQTMLGKISATEGAKRMVKEMDGLLERAGYKQLNPHK
jgi:ABC-type glycerol-3-phosphate transport system substrate-binding protein